MPSKNQAETALGKKMEEIANNVSSNYSRQKQGNNFAQDTPFSAVLWFGTRDNYSNQEKRNPLKQWIKGVEFGTLPLYIGVCVALPPLVPFIAPLAAIQTGLLETFRRKVNKDTKQVETKFDDAKQQLNIAIETVKKAHQEFVRDPVANRKQLQEVLSSFEELFSEKNGFQHGTFNPTRGIRSTGSQPMDKVIQSTVNEVYLNATRALSDNTGSTSRQRTTGMERGIAPQIEPKPQTRNPEIGGLGR